MGEISFWHFQTILVKIFFKNLIHKKRKILGVAQNGSISADWIFRVANFEFHYLRHLFLNRFLKFLLLVPIWLQISWIFGNTPNILYWKGFWREFWTKNTKFKNQKMCYFKPTHNHMVQKYQNEIAPIFFYVQKLIKKT